MKVTTRGCRRHGQPEFVVEYDQSVVPQQDISWLVSLLEASVASGKRYSPQQTLLVGWTEMMIGEGEQGYLQLLEPDWSGTLPLHYVPGVTQTLVQLRRQKDVAESLGLGGRLAFPALWQSAIVCDQVGARGCGIMDRVEPEGQDSGWFFGCDDPRHNHNDGGVLRRRSLYEIGCQLPGIVQFCALPPGSNLSLGGTEGIVVALDGHEIPIRPGSYLGELSHLPPSH